MAGDSRCPTCGEQRMFAFLADSEGIPVAGGMYCRNCQTFEQPKAALEEED